MAKVTLTFEDTGDEVAIRFESDPPLPDGEGTGAQGLGVACLETVQYLLTGRQEAAKAESETDRLRLFVWQGDFVLEDYTSGMVAVLASDEDHAWALLKDADPHAYSNLQTRLSAPIKPVCVMEPAAFICWGGG